jgi:tetratricopeptide (TPR) repeat protein/Mg-chelatase subunit ChlD
MDHLQAPSPRRKGRKLGSLLVLATTLGILTVVGSSCRTDQVPVKAPALGSSLELASGEVVLVTDAGDQMLLSGTPLPMAATLRTGKGARALIRLGDGTRVFLRDNTTVELGDGLALASGQAWIEAPPVEQGRRTSTHRIGTLMVALADGGASLSTLDGKTEVYVAEGLAVLTGPGGRAEVHPGERGLVEGMGAPAIEPVKYWDDWTGGMGDHSALSSQPWVGTGSIFAIDPMQGADAPALPLAIQRQTVQVAIEDQIAETRVEQVFFNPASGDVEGWYWFTVPEDALLIGFALETNGQLVEGEVVERKQAAATYEAAVRRANDPALLEWIDARTVRARIFPIPGAGTRRVVVRYQQLLSETDNRLHYAYPMAAPVGREAAAIEEFSLAVELRGDVAEQYELATSSEARVEGRKGERISMRRSGFTPRADFELELTRKNPAAEDAPPPLRVSLFESGRDQADYVMLRWVPKLDLSHDPVPKGEVVIVVDTSAGSDPAEHQAKLAVAEAMLRSLSPDDRFALVAADLGAQVLYPEKGLSEATPEALDAALEALAQRDAGGATDLAATFEQALERVHGLEQPAIVYVGDGLATSGEVDGDALADRLRRSLAGSRARLFTVAVGREVELALLGRLARVGGGKLLRVEEPAEAVVRALELAGALKTPTLTDVEIDIGEGLDDVFLNYEGKLSRGQELIMLGRTHHDLPEQVVVRYRYGGQVQEETIALELDDAITSRMVPRLWAHAYVQQLLSDARGLEAVRGKVLSLGLEFGLMTPFTSFLALDSESAYGRSGIERRQRDFLRLIGDADFMHGEPLEPRDPTALELLGAAASAPLGCAAEPSGKRTSDEANSDRKQGKFDASSADEDAGGSGQRHKGEEGRMGRPTSGNRFAQEQQLDARLEPTPEQAQAWGTVTTTPQAGDVEPLDPIELAGKSGTLGVFRFEDAIAPDEPAWQTEQDRKANLDAVGLGNAGAPPQWVEESTRSELARRGMWGQEAVLTSPVPRAQALPCSDASNRSLFQRKLLWQRRLARQTSMAGRLQVYEASSAACELPRWRDQQVLLELLQASVETEAEIRLLLGHFAGDRDAQQFLGRALMRRLVDSHLLATVEHALFGVQDWFAIDQRLAVTDDPDARLAILNGALQASPGDPDGERRMIAELVARGRAADAIARGRRLREQGSLTPELVLILGELLAKQGDEAAAKRLFSELVEFAPDSLVSRKLLGDTFLRHGWHEDAYRQYALLMQSAEAPWVALRMARAAAGTGRTDEALRLLRRVASGEGRPGADDPRRWARLHAAGLLAELLAGGSEGAKDLPKDKLEAELRAQGLFESPNTWELLIWDDLDADLMLSDRKPEDGKKPTAAELGAEAVDADGTGLFALQSSKTLGELFVRHRGLVPNRDVKWRRITIRWDGATFAIEQREGWIAAKRARADMQPVGAVEEKPAEGATP